MTKLRRHVIFGLAWFLALLHAPSEAHTGAWRELQTKGSNWRPGSRLGPATSPFNQMDWLAATPDGPIVVDWQTDPTTGVRKFRLRTCLLSGESKESPGLPGGPITGAFVSHSSLVVVYMLAGRIVASSLSLPDYLPMDPRVRELYVPTETERVLQALPIFQMENCVGLFVTVKNASSGALTSRLVPLSNSDGSINSPVLRRDVISLELSPAATPLESCSFKLDGSFLAIAQQGRVARVHIPDGKVEMQFSDPSILVAGMQVNRINPIREGYEDVTFGGEYFPWGPPLKLAVERAVEPWKMDEAELLAADGKVFDQDWDYGEIVAMRASIMGDELFLVESGDVMRKINASGVDGPTTGFQLLGYSEAGLICSVVIAKTSAEDEGEIRIGWLAKDAQAIEWFFSQPLPEDYPEHVTGEIWMRKLPPGTKDCFILGLETSQLDFYWESTPAPRRYWLEASFQIPGNEQQFIHFCEPLKQAVS